MMVQLVPPAPLVKQAQLALLGLKAPMEMPVPRAQQALLVLPEQPATRAHKAQLAPQAHKAQLAPQAPRVRKVLPATSVKLVLPVLLAPLAKQEQPAT